MTTLEKLRKANQLEDEILSLEGAVKAWQRLKKDAVESNCAIYIRYSGSQVKLDPSEFQNLALYCDVTLKKLENQKAKLQEELDSLFDGGDS
jgi:hypothetical protein